MSECKTDFMTTYDGCEKCEPKKDCPICGDPMEYKRGRSNVNSNDLQIILGMWKCSSCGCVVMPKRGSCERKKS